MTDAEETAARARGEQVTRCRYCRRLIADPFHWTHEDRHAARGDRLPEDRPRPAVRPVAAPDGRPR